MKCKVFLLYWLFTVLALQLFSQSKLQPGRYRSFDLFEFSLSDRLGLFDSKPDFVLRKYDNHGGYKFLMNTKWAHREFFVRNYKDTMIIMTVKKGTYTDRVIWKSERNFIVHFKSLIVNPSEHIVFFYSKNDSCLNVDIYKCYLPDKNYSEITPENILSVRGSSIAGTFRFAVVSNKLEYRFCSEREFMIPDCDRIRYYSEGKIFEESLFIFLVNFPRRR